MDCRHGTFVFPKDTYIGKSLEKYGEYSEQEVAFLCLLLNPGDVVVDAGANIGALTVPLAKAVGETGKVLAYEPQDDIFEMLRENCAGLPQVVAIHGAVGEVDTVLRYSPNAWNTGNVVLGKTGDCTTAVVPLDAAKMPRLDLLKADVEGMETEVLFGARETIARCRPLLYVENERKHNTRRLLDTLFLLGYRVWRHEPFLFDANNFRGDPEDIFPGVGSMNLIAVPVERDPPPQVAGLVEVHRLQRKDAPKARWACIARMGGWGDNLIASSVFPALKAKYGNLEVISRAPCSAVFENNPYIDKLTIWPADEKITDQLEWARALDRRMKEYDFGVHLSHTCETTLAFMEPQYQFWWPEKIRRQWCDKSYLGLVHDICDLPHDFAPNFFPTEAEMTNAHHIRARILARRDAPLVGWVLSGSRIDKAYPGSVSVISRLLEAGLNVVMFGAPGKEFLMAQAIEKQVVQELGPDDRGSAAGLTLCMSASEDKPDWPMRRSLTQVQLCDVVVSPDTGPAWAVAMLPVPKIILLSHASEKNITEGWRNTVSLHADPARVSCWPCHRLQDGWNTCRKVPDIDAAACISDIPVSSIVTHVHTALGASNV